jgi:hypothetical protein
MGQGESVVNPLSTRGDKRLAHFTLDREDGFRGACRCRTDFRFAA